MLAVATSATWNGSTRTARGRKRSSKSIFNSKISRECWKWSLMALSSQSSSRLRQKRLNKNFHFLVIVVLTTKRVTIRYIHTSNAPQTRNEKMTIATQIEPAVVINGTLYVVVGSGMNGKVEMKELVGPKGARFFLMVYTSGKQELLSKNMRTVWTSK